ncbi:MAG: 2-succinyl-5-enolpyruvyl-6-hydroxy-3-cyclohexene-1-carboxylic-acid synthase, partial [Bacteroidota bacterium]
RDFCIAPGSRNTPLVAAVAEHPEAVAHVHYDERGTSFFALGLGRATGRPAAWITTSGTAVANGLPAVVEAEQDHVPLLLLTADRPPELLDAGANQAIDQNKIFGTYPRWYAALPTEHPDADPAYVLTTAAQAVFRATSTPAGPVHLNCHFREPLQPEAQPDRRLPAYLNAWRTSGRPYTHYSAGHLDPMLPGELVDAISGAERGLLIAGRLEPEEAAGVRQLQAHLGWPLLPDLTSQLRLGPAGTGTITHYDLLLNDRDWADDHRPDVILHIGGKYVSKRLLQFTARCAEAGTRLVVANPTPFRLDPHHRVSDRVQADVVPFCTRLIEQTSVYSNTSWTEAWTRAQLRVEHIVAEELPADVLSEPLVAQLVTQLAPAETGLFAAASMPVRDLDAFGARNGPGLRVAANRGASGIDGTLSCAAGFAAGLERPTTLLTGDLSFLHDLNGVLLARRHPLVTVLINNDGGGIFHFLPIHRYEHFEPFFGTPHGIEHVEHIARQAELPYNRPRTPDAFRTVYTEAMESGRPALIEIRTDRTENVALHRRIAEAIRIA